MKTKLTCPVCDRVDIESDVCPNCETDLSLLRILAELPPVVAASPVTPQKQPIAVWWFASIAILILVSGMGLGVAGNFFYSQQKPSSIATASLKTVQPIKQASISVKRTNSETKTQKSKAKIECTGGFYYQIRRGDSLSLIALRFYGNSNLWFKIALSNPQLKARKNYLEVGETLLVSNLKENCR